ncbi:pyridoxal phosphate-dependent aminotransferase, partial [Burkholderia multivorans]|uniref:aminotransferase class I/II-fold pyridoxal phosphate-dependent enzyme n=1 Tax=Burkholderia multivorans TaxID=87883 RepID=UPI000DB52B94
VKLTVGEPDFPTPEHIKAAGIRAIEDDATKYVANAGLPDLREAIAGKYSARWNREIGVDIVMVTFGAMGALTLSRDTTVSPGQEVSIADPCFPNYL